MRHCAATSGRRGRSSSGDMISSKTRPPERGRQPLSGLERRGRFFCAGRGWERLTCGSCALDLNEPEQSEHVGPGCSRLENRIVPVAGSRTRTKSLYLPASVTIPDHRHPHDRRLSREEERETILTREAILANIASVHLFFKERTIDRR